MIVLYKNVRHVFRSSNNISRLPSPYWDSRKIFHINEQMDVTVNKKAFKLYQRLKKDIITHIYDNDFCGLRDYQSRAYF